MACGHAILVANTRYNSEIQFSVERPNRSTMKPKIYLESNEQEYLAEQFRISENHVKSASKIALLKIQSLKFAHKTPEIGQTYLESVEDIVRRSFFSFVPAYHVLSEESFFFTPLEN